MLMKKLKTKTFFSARSNDLAEMRIDVVAVPVAAPTRRFGVCATHILIAPSECDSSRVGHMKNRAIERNLLEFWALKVVSPSCDSTL